MKRHIILFASFFLLSGMLYAAYTPSLGISASYAETYHRSIVYPTESFRLEVSPLAFEWGDWCMGLLLEGESYMESVLVHGRVIPQRYKLAMDYDLGFKMEETIRVHLVLGGGFELFPNERGGTVFLRLQWRPEVGILPWLYATTYCGVDLEKDHADLTFQLGLKILGGQK